jgi:uncharacterized protein with ATP-grasp and redox domains
MNPISPRLPAPTPLLGAETGTFAHRTVTVRLPEIGRRILAENDFSTRVAGQLKTLLDEMPDAVVRDLHDREAPDWAAWRGYLALYTRKNWLGVPWFFAETYFYRRILEATGYFQPSPGFGVDPYAYQKRQGLEAFVEPIQASCEAVNTLCAKINQPPGKLSLDLVNEMILTNLWGNQVDLSLWPVGHAERPDHADRSGQLTHMPCNHALQAVEYLLAANDSPRRVDIMLDNAGLELVHDLLLADFLLGNRLASSIRLHAKAHPTFVSDAILRDIRETMIFLAQMGDRETRAVSERMNTALQTGQLQLRDHFFWTSPLSMWEMPDDLRKELGEAALVISKGDANYRRLVGDRHWTFDTPLEGVWNYFPTSLLALRVSKSEVMIGLQPGQAHALSQVDPQWMTDGRWGLVQFYRGTPLTASQP